MLHNQETQIFLLLLIFNCSDVSPDNVLLTAIEENPDWPTVPIWEVTAKLGDFGLAKQHNYGSQSFSHSLVGTPTYMAPEQFVALVSGNANFRGQSRMDIFPVGIIAHQLFTGARMKRMY